MVIADWLTANGGLAALVLGLVLRFIWLRRPSVAANCCFSLGVLLQYASWFLRYQTAGFDPIGHWGYMPTGLEVMTILIFGGMLLCWRAKSGTGRTFGVVAIIAGFVVVYPGVLFPIELVEGGTE